MASDTDKTDEINTGNTDIELIAGNTNILLVAPHGHPEDDKNTGKIARIVAEQNGCYAIINEIYSKPDNSDNDESADKKAKKVNLNRQTQVKKHLTKEFLLPILKYKNEIVKDFGHALVFWIHGVEDKNIKLDVKEAPGVVPDDVKVLIGWGQKTRKNRHTAKSVTVNKLMEGLTNNDLTAVLSNPDKTIDIKSGIVSYCGWDKNNMNQLFNVEEYQDTNVESIQLEFRMTGCRRSEDIEKTATNIAKAISSLLQSETEADQHEDATVKDSNKPEVVGDDLKIEEAYQHLKNIFANHFQKAMLEAGQYLIKQLYDGDYERAQEKEVIGTQSLSKLIKKLQGETQGNAPSRTWVYDAVNLAIDHHLFEQKILPSVYGQLGHSHQVNLTYSPNLEIKQSLTTEAVEKKYTVSRLRERIREEKRKEETDYVSVKEKILPEKLEGRTAKQLSEMKNQVLGFEKKIQEQLIIYRSNLEKIEKALKGKQVNNKVTGFQEWTESKNNVNICTGCPNDCKYCYAKSIAYRFKQVEEGQWANEQIRAHDVEKKQKLYSGRVGFPTSHDITLTNIDAYSEVLEKLLVLGNEVLIVSKPKFECIKRVCDTMAKYKEKILFRFTIGAIDDDVLKFWDTNAPLYNERKKSLKYAFENGFQTSVSMEPLLEPTRVVDIVTDLEPYISDFIWIGKMNHTSQLKTRATKDNDLSMLERIKTIEQEQTDGKILSIYSEFKEKPALLKKLKWKDSYKKVLGIEKATEPGMDI